MHRHGSESMLRQGAKHQVQRASICILTCVCVSPITFSTKPQRGFALPKYRNVLSIAWKAG